MFQGKVLSQEESHHEQRETRAASADGRDGKDGEGAKSGSKGIRTAEFLAELMPLIAQNFRSLAAQRISKRARNGKHKKQGRASSQLGAHGNRQGQSRSEKGGPNSAAHLPRVARHSARAPRGKRRARSLETERETVLLLRYVPRNFTVLVPH